MTQTPTERPDSADEIEVLLQRAAPGALEKGELVDQVGLTTDELREGLGWLEAQGQVKYTEDGDFDGYVWVEEGAAPREPDAPADEEEDDDDPRAAPGPALDAHVRARFQVVASFSGSSSDDASIRKAQVLADEIGNALAIAFPKLALHVDVEAVEAFDNPRALWPQPADED